jgi:hypothetical protein
MFESSSASSEINVWPGFVDLVLLSMVIVVLVGTLMIAIITKDSWKYKQIQEKMRQFRTEFEYKFPPHQEQDRIQLIDNPTRPNEQIIIFGGDLLFDTLDHQLSRRGKTYLEKLESIFVSRGEMRSWFSEIQILGHTDDQPIYNYQFSEVDITESVAVLDLSRAWLKQTNYDLWKKLQSKRFPTNWELSSARAVSVVRFFVDAEALSVDMEDGRYQPTDQPTNSVIWTATGCSRFQPRTDIPFESIEHARTWNRRVEIRLIYEVPK